ncbi:MAG: hypothetical protein KDA92_08400, partial [Planctomycetales bacterium]|nr:hypothetical protein [Planctomycetales bacterium]
MSGQTTSDARKQQLRTLLDEVLVRRDAGELLTDEMLVEGHPELMPELAEQLRFLRMLQEASSVSVNAIERPTGEVCCPACSRTVEASAVAASCEVTCEHCGHV